MRVEALASIAGAPVPRVRNGEVQGYVHPLLVRGGDGVGPELIEAYAPEAHPAFSDEADMNAVVRVVLEVGQRTGQTLDDAGRAKNYAFQSVRLLKIESGQRAAQPARPDGRQTG